MYTTGADTNPLLVSSAVDLISYFDVTVILKI